MVDREKGYFNKTFEELLAATSNLQCSSDHIYDNKCKKCLYNLGDTDVICFKQIKFNDEDPED